MFIHWLKPVSMVKSGYTPGVTARRLSTAIGIASALAWLGLASDVSAQNKPTPPHHDVARTAGQAAKAVADAANSAADGAVPTDSSNKSPVDSARQGVVVLERAGKPVGVGSVLKGDGRILTALSILGNGNNVDARFADGSVSHVRVGHTDRAWDLALLIPQNGRWKDGLRASRTPAVAAGSDLRAFSLMGGNSLALSRTIVKGETTLLGGDSELLRDALEFASRFKDTDVGSPVIDSKGDVVALIASACAPVKDGPCLKVPYGVPVAAIKAFLRTVPAAAVPPAPWLGIQGVGEDTGVVRGVRVLEVHEASPAGAAGLSGGSDKATSDIIVAVEGSPTSTPEQLAQAINSRAVGDSVRLLVFGGGKFRELSLTLRSSPNSGSAAGVASQPRRTGATPATAKPVGPRR